MKRTTSLLALLGAGSGDSARRRRLLDRRGRRGADEPVAADDHRYHRRSARCSRRAPARGTARTPITYAYQWRRCGPNGGSCSNISGANKSTYTLKSRRSRQHHACARHGEERRRLGAGRVRSDQTSSTAPAATGSDRLPDGHRPDERLGRVAAGTASDRRPGGVADHRHARRHSDLTLRFHVSACGGRSIAGALVYATAVPFEQFNVPPEATTGDDGWATLTLHRASRFPASSVQQLLAVFVRARKSGDPLLAGISTRILVSFPVNLHG